MNQEKEKPELVSTDSGFSVFYQNKYLYSKRNPKKSILSIIDKTTVLEQTLVLCISPILGYGLEELLAKTPENSIILTVEKDQALMDLFLQSIDENKLSNKKFIYLKTNSIANFLEEIEPEIINKQIRRMIKIDFSGGANLNKEFYNELTDKTGEFISRYWINRLTLIQFGRNYARNFFKNFSSIAKSSKTKNAPEFTFINLNSIKKPILVIGAGPSLDHSLKFIEKNQNMFFILAVDAASGIYPKIKPDAIAILESQYWIQRAFIGLANSKIPLLMDLTTNPKIAYATGGKVALFYTEYIKNDFFRKIDQKQLLPIKMTPMGSVGLSALELADKLAAPGIPIFHTGLDFSWGAGLSHTKASYQAKELMSSNSKLNNLYSNFTPSSVTCEKLIGKNQDEVFTTPNLKSYAEIYKAVFSKKNNFFDIGNSGILINSNIISLEQAEEILTYFYRNNKIEESQVFTNSYSEKKEAITNFLNEEKSKLIELKDSFTGKKEFNEKRVEDLLIDSPYLYLHFPDYSNAIKLEQNFLRRLRIEIEYFLKTLS